MKYTLISTGSLRYGQFPNLKLVHGYEWFRPTLKKRTINIQYTSGEYGPFQVLVNFEIFLQTSLGHMINFLPQQLISLKFRISPVGYETELFK